LKNFVQTSQLDLGIRRKGKKNGKGIVHKRKNAEGKEREAGEWERQEKLDNKKADKDIKRIQLKF